MTSSLSILGLYRYDPNIFDGMSLPNGVDRGLLVDNLVCELGCLEVLYPSAPFMADMIRMWSVKERPTWERMYTAMQLQYNPLENYDRMEEWKDDKTDRKNNTVKDKTNFNGHNTTIDSNTQTTTNKTLDHTVTNLTTDHKISGYNDSNLVPHSQDIENGATKDVENGVVSDSGNAYQDGYTTNEREGNSTEDSTGNAVHEGRVHGNIGVTTSQQMLQSELDIVPQLNIINYIINSFKNRFCILVY